MLLVPQTSRVVLTFDTGAGIYLWGKILSLLTILVLILKASLPGPTIYPFFRMGAALDFRAEKSHGGKALTRPNPGPPGRKNRGKRQVLSRIGPAGRYYSWGQY